jgi:hypothetical protein
MGHLGDIVSAHRADIVERWRAEVVGCYAAETVRFLRSERDPFANPVGATIHRATDGVVDAIIAGSEPADVAELVEAVVRIRAVQDMAASEAVQFAMQLRGVIEAVVADAGVSLDRAAADELHSWVDRLALLAFDRYTSCRQQVYEIRIQQIRGRALERMERLQEWESSRGGGKTQH